MFKDLFSAIKYNINQKSTNPFLGTYTMVWIIRHWELIYGVFAFSDDWKLYQKLSFIKTHLRAVEIWEDVLWNTFISFGVLLGTYVLLNISRLIINVFEKQITPRIYKISDPSSIVVKSLHEKVRNERDDFRKLYDNERDTRSGFESELKNLQNKLNDLESDKRSLKKDIRIHKDNEASHLNKNEILTSKYDTLREYSKKIKLENNNLKQRVEELRVIQIDFSKRGKEDQFDLQKKIDGILKSIKQTPEIENPFMFIEEDDIE